MNPLLEALADAPDLADHPGLRRLRAAVRRARPVVPAPRDHEALVRAFEAEVRRRCAADELVGRRAAEPLVRT